MKKKFALALALALSLSLTACNKPESKPAASSPEQSVTESTPEQPEEPAPEQPEEPAPTEPAPEQQPESTDPVETPVEKPVEVTKPVETKPVETTKPVDLFTDTNETVYATSTVNIRSKPDTNSKKLGQLVSGNSVNRIGVGRDSLVGWSEVKLTDGTIAYIRSDYLSTTKPVQQQPQQQTQQTQKPTQQQTQQTQQSKPTQQTQQQSKPSNVTQTNDGPTTKAQEEAAKKNNEVLMKEQNELIADAAGSSGADGLNDGLRDADGNFSTDEIAQHLKENPIPGVQHVIDESGARGFIIPY